MVNLRNLKLQNISIAQPNVKCWTNSDAIIGKICPRPSSDPVMCPLPDFSVPTPHSAPSPTSRSIFFIRRLMIQPEISLESSKNVEHLDIDEMIKLLMKLDIIKNESKI